jgi:hypothetical protein
MMKISLRWETIGTRRVLYYEFQAGWTWEEFFAIKSEADPLLAAEEKPLPLIFDLRSAPNMPPGMILQSRNIAENRHPKGSPVILLGANRLVQATFEIVKRMLGEKAEKLTGDVVVVLTWDDAAVYLANHSKTPDLL